MWRYVLYFVAPIHFVAGQSHPKSCADLIKADVKLQRGEYTIYNNNDQAFKVFCDFHNGYGYTYINPTTTVQVDMANLYTDSNHVNIVDRRKDRSQYQARMEQIPSFRNTPLSLQYNAHTGYQGIQNAAMSPYIFVGFIPLAVIQRGQVEGYTLNGRDITFRNCDGNGNSYFAFLFNSNNAAPSAYHPTNSDLQHHWIDGATRVPSGQEIPDQYFSFFEMHFGGCGAYGTPQHLPQVSGAALGLRFDINCTTPKQIQNAAMTFTSTSVGSTVTYTCDVGYTHMGGDLSRQCANNGQWTGGEPVCGSFPCDSHPCQNGGLCYEVVGLNFVCECLEGYGGDLCQNAL